LCIFYILNKFSVINQKKSKIICKKSIFFIEHNALGITFFVSMAQGNLLTIHVRFPYL